LPALRENMQSGEEELHEQLCLQSQACGSPRMTTTSMVPILFTENAFEQLIYFFIYSDRYYAFIFLICAVLFGVDILLLLWVLSIHAPNKPPLYIIYLNVLSNAISLTFYCVGHGYLLSDSSTSVSAMIFSVIILLILVVLKLIRIIVIYRFERYCERKDEAALAGDNYNNLSNDGVTNVTKQPYVTKQEINV